jgi:hypothetical protein
MASPQQIRRPLVILAVANRDEQQQAKSPEVPAGRYALDFGDDQIRFYKVDRPTKGSWAGRTFVSVQASDEFHPVRDANSRRAILAQIAADPQAAMALYGQEIGCCGHCGRVLTSDWRKRGIGPVCVQQMGW